jgi:predicted membrane chloride channel (bestrophin family)
LNRLVFIWGVLALIAVLIGFVPGLEVLNYANLPFAIIGCILGIIAVFRNRGGYSRTAYIGIALTAVASLIGMIRLTIVGGV